MIYDKDYSCFCEANSKANSEKIPYVIYKAKKNDDDKQFSFFCLPYKKADETLKLFSKYVSELGLNTADDVCTNVTHYKVVYLNPISNTTISVAVLDLNSSCLDAIIDFSSWVKNNFISNFMDGSGKFILEGVSSFKYSPESVENAIISKLKQDDIDDLYEIILNKYSAITKQSWIDSRDVKDKNLLLFFEKNGWRVEYNCIANQFLFEK